MQQRTIEDGHRDTKEMWIRVREPARRKGLCHWGVKSKSIKKEGSSARPKKGRGNKAKERKKD